MTARPKVHDLRGPLVFAVHPTRDDVSAARQWGTITYINAGYVYGDQLFTNPQGTDQLPNDTRASLISASDRFNPDTDFVLIMGDHLQLVMFVAALSVRFDRFKVLRYDRTVNGYLAVEIAV